MEVEESNNSEICLGLSYRRGLRRNLFEKPGGHFLSKLGGDLWGSYENIVPTSTSDLQRLISLESIASL